jgi:RNA polymerase sigma-70 factor (ECF subfamily)
VQPEPANIKGFPQSRVPIDDAALLEKWRWGDSAAMEGLILKYQNRLFNVILKICANLDDAAELTQETFVKIIQGIDKFEGKSSFYTWAFRIAVNLTLNYCQRNARIGFQSLDADDYENHPSTGSRQAWPFDGLRAGSERGRRVLKEFLSDNKSPDPAVVAQNKELCDIVVKSLMKLDDAQRTVIVLRDIEGMNYAQIAKVLDIELGTVRSRLSRGRSRLREIMEAIAG